MLRGAGWRARGQGPRSTSSTGYASLSALVLTRATLERMTAYVFRGTVLPRRAEFSITPVRGVLKTPSGRLLRVEVEVTDSRVTVAVEVDEWSFSLYDLRDTVEEIAASYVDGYAFTVGLGFRVDVEDCVLPDGTVRSFGARYGMKFDVEPLGLSAEDVLNCAEKSHYFRLALADLRKAEWDPLDCRFFCRRAVERVRHHFAPGSKDRSRGWGEVQSTLRIDEEALRRTGAMADDLRHGNVGDPGRWPAGDDFEVSADELVQLFAFARACVARLGRYLKSPESLDSAKPLTWPVHPGLPSAIE